MKGFDLFPRNENYLKTMSQLRICIKYGNWISIDQLRKYPMIKLYYF